MKENDVIKFIKKFAIFVLILLFIICSILFGITQMYNRKFRTSYQYAINLKYNSLMNTKSPKIVIVGGSSSAFGINNKTIEEKMKTNVVNLALHAGFGIEFQTELAKANIQSGDLIVLAYEYALYGSSPTDIELVTTGIDNNIKLYQYVSKDDLLSIIKYFPTYMLKKLDINSKEPIGVYTINSFDKNGNMIYERPKCVLPTDIPREIYGSMKISTITLKEKEKIYINEFYEYCRDKGADVVITFSPVINERFYGTDDEIKNFENMLKTNLKPTVISNVRDYIFSREYMYDTLYHCNSIGAEIRSEKLSNDIKNYLESAGV